MDKKHIELVLSGTKDGIVKADLHLHTFFSDGDDSPEEVIKLAKAAGVVFVSVTDHDTCDGVERALLAAENIGIAAISGVEFSCQGAGEVHILGYGMDILDADFNAQLARLKKLREQRIAETIKKLQGMGIDIEDEDVVCGDSGICGRTHVAKALIQKGYCQNVAQAFDRFLAYGRSAYVQSHRLSVSQAIEIIKSAGGKSVLAHPSQISCAPQHLTALIEEYAAMGLDGIEAGYYAHTTQEQKYYNSLANSLKLIKTCGSDYHGQTRKSPVKAFALAEEDFLRLVGGA